MGLKNSDLSIRVWAILFGFMTPDQPLTSEVREKVEAELTKRGWN